MPLAQTITRDTFLRRVDEARTRKGWSDQRTCQEAGIGLTWLKDYRRRGGVRPGAAIVTRLAAALDLPAADLLEEHPKADEAGDISIDVAAFKARCLPLIDEVAQGHTRRVLLLKHNQPVAALVPVEREPVDLWGALRGTVTVSPGTDLTAGTGEIWTADS